MATYEEIPSREQTFTRPTITLSMRLWDGPGYTGNSRKNRNARPQAYQCTDTRSGQFSVKCCRASNLQHQIVADAVSLTEAAFHLLCSFQIRSPASVRQQSAGSNFCAVASIVILNPRYGVVDIFLITVRLRAKTSPCQVTARNESTVNRVKLLTF